MQDHNVLFTKLQPTTLKNQGQGQDQGHPDMIRAELYVIASQKLKYFLSSRHITYRLIGRHLRAIELRAW